MDTSTAYFNISRITTWLTIATCTLLAYATVVVSFGSLKETASLLPLLEVGVHLRPPYSSPSTVATQTIILLPSSSPGSAGLHFKGIRTSSPSSMLTSPSCSRSTCGKAEANRCNNTQMVGELDLSTPPYFHPGNCDVWPHTPVQAKQCFANRSIFVMGNSVGRAYAFELESVLKNGVPLDRDKQKRTCLKGEAWQPHHMESCTLTFSHGTSAHFLWRQFFAEAPHEGKLTNEGDMCFDVNVSACLRAFWPTSRSGDILLITQGLFYARYPNHVGTSEAHSSLEQVVVRDAESLISTVENSFKGSLVVVINTAPMRDDTPAGTNTRVTAINNALRPVWIRAGYALVDQELINVAALRAIDGQRYYFDHVHFPGPLSAAAWHYVLSLACGRPADDAGATTK